MNEYFEGICDAFAKAARLTADELDRLKRSVIARLITMGPYLAGAEDADRWAMQALATYWLATFGGPFRAREEDFTDHGRLHRRLDSVLAYPGDSAMKLWIRDFLVLAMLSDMRRDKAEDLIENKHNPYDEMLDKERNRLLAMTEAAPDELLAVAPVEAVAAGWWIL